MGQPHKPARDPGTPRVWARLWTHRRAWSSTLAAALALCLWAAPAWAQSGGGLFQAGSEALAPPATEAPQAQPDPQEDPALALAVEEALGVYIVHAKLREELERVEARDGVAEVWFLRDLDINAQDARCDAYRWLLLGRFEDNPGALPLFKEQQGLQMLKLVFYSVQTRVRVNARGDYVQSRTPVRQLELNLSRAKARAIDAKALQKALGGSREACIANGESLVDHHWYIH